MSLYNFENILFVLSKLAEYFNEASSIFSYKIFDSVLNLPIIQKPNVNKIVIPKI